MELDDLIAALQEAQRVRHGLPTSVAIEVLHEDAEGTGVAYRRHATARVRLEDVHDGGKITTCPAGLTVVLEAETAWTAQDSRGMWQPASRQEERART